MPRWFSLSRLGWSVVAVMAIAATAAADPVARHFTYQGPTVFTRPSQAAAISPYLFFNRCVGNCTIHGGMIDDARSNDSSIPCPAPQCSGGGCTCPGGSSGTWTVHEFQNQFGDIGGNGHCYGDTGATACTMDSQCSGTCTGAGSTCAGGTHAGATCTTDMDCKDICDTADYEWSQIMQCLKEVYSPYNVMVTDQVPGGGLSFTEDFIAGSPADIGYGAAGVGGIAPGTCDAKDNVVSFSFSNVSFWGTGQTRIWNICATAGQESAHAFGLEHEYDFISAYQSTDMGSTCMDPMTYRTDCGGEHFFRNAPAHCGEFAERPCNCGSVQNSHLKILNVFGAGTSIVPAPTASIIFPATNTMVTGNFVIDGLAYSKRGIDHVELWLNGYPWATVAGGAFGQNGQPQSTYTLTAPGNVPNSVIDVVIKAYDDLGAVTASDPITVTKGGPCTSAMGCLTGQKCTNGRCAWDPPSGMLGDACSYDQFCVSGMCSPTTSDQKCTQECTPGVSDGCPMGYDCIEVNTTTGFCYPSSGGGGGGCCQTSSSGAGWIPGGLAALVLGLVIRRRRRS